MNAPTVLVTGGAGFIGSHMVKCLRRAGYAPLVLDTLANGHRAAVPPECLVVGDCGDAATLETLMQVRPVHAILHFAGVIQVGESLRLPDLYYAANVSASVALCAAAVRHKVSQFIFSSTAAIFGTPQTSPINEAQPSAPINPYGRSKWMVEQILGDFDRAYGLRSVCLRYFNAAGADPEGELGEMHEPETHLLPLLLQVASGRRPALSIYGDDYPTPDGTCVRDYIHVSDLCDAHLLALQYLEAGGPSAQFNLGNGNGFSVRAAIEAARRVSQRPIPITVAPRRPGDPPVLVADASQARATLGWRPRYPDLETMLAHAWAWETRHDGHD